MQFLPAAISHPDQRIEADHQNGENRQLHRTAVERMLLIGTRILVKGGPEQLCPTTFLSLHDSHDQLMMLATSSQAARFNTRELVKTKTFETRVNLQYQRCQNNEGRKSFGCWNRI